MNHKELTPMAPGEFEKYIGQLPFQTQAALSSYMEERIRSLAEELVTVSVDNIWIDDRNAKSYWLLLMNGVDDKTEKKLAQTLLSWREFEIGEYARVRCVQRSDKELSKFCLNNFDLHTLPALIISSDSNFDNYSIIEENALTAIFSNPKKFKKTLSSIHQKMSLGVKLSTINKELVRTRLFQNLKIVYNEVKSIISITIKAG